MAITRTAMIDDDGSGTTGTIINNAWKQEFYGQIDSLVAPYGTWVDVPFNAANFTTDTGAVWTVAGANVPTHRYAVVGHTMFYRFVVSTSTISGANPSSLYVKLPTGYTGATLGITPFLYTQAGTNILGYAITSSDLNAGVLQLSRLNQEPWSQGVPIAAYVNLTLDVA